MTKAMSQLGVEIVFVLPKPVRSMFSTHVRLLAPLVGRNPGQSTEEGTWEVESLEHVTFKTVPVQAFSVYSRPKIRLKQPKGQGWGVVDPSEAQDPLAVSSRVGRNANGTPAEGPTDGSVAMYAGDMFTQIERYAKMVGQIAAAEDFDVIHAHDWMTYPAGVAAAALSGKPLVIHVHST
ncbi:unnamed protein product, partial [marine sediment metagenome]